MRKSIALLLAGAMICTSLTGCSSKGEQAGSQGKETKAGSGVGLNVTTTFAGEDGNAANYKKAVADWEAKTGNTVNDASAISDETFKARVTSDFQMGSEPDVLFYFNGADANSFIEAEKVVSIDEIREVYPEFASNMNDDLITASLVDGKKYAVPVNGYWEALYYNTEVLEAAGVQAPGKDYTWDQFLSDCEKIKGAGYIPIASSLGEIPHYWWEYCIFNQQMPEQHLNIPESADDENGQTWVNGIADIRICLKEAVIQRTPCPRRTMIPL